VNFRLGLRGLHNVSNDREHRVLLIATRLSRQGPPLNIGSASTPPVQIFTGFRNLEALEGSQQLFGRCFDFSIM
jgi:hypothetical protein